jgi:molecular chaperone GrpE (heat shock protein)
MSTRTKRKPHKERKPQYRLRFPLFTDQGIFPTRADYEAWYGKEKERAIQDMRERYIDFLSPTPRQNYYMQLAELKKENESLRQAVDDARAEMYQYRERMEDGETLAYSVCLETKIEEVISYLRNVARHSLENQAALMRHGPFHVKVNAVDQEIAEAIRILSREAADEPEAGDIPF